MVSVGNACCVVAAEINFDYQNQLRQLRETMSLLTAQNLATDKVKTKYVSVVAAYKAELI